MCMKFRIHSVDIAVYVKIYSIFGIHCLPDPILIRNQHQEN